MARFSTSSRNSHNSEAEPNGLSSNTGQRHRSVGSVSNPSIDRTKSDHELDTSAETMVGLQKKVGLVGGVSLIVGTIIGSGIFISPTGVTEGSGSVGLSLITWTICGVIAMGGAVSYAELGTMIPKSGAEYSYMLEAFGPLGRFGAIPAFLFSWVMVFILRPAMLAIIVLAFAEYCTAPFYDVCAPSVVAVKCLAALCILVLTVLNCWNVRWAMALQTILTVAKLIAIVIIIIGGFVMMGQGRTEHLNNAFEGTSDNVGKIAIGFYSGMWAYDGWNNLNYVTEELIDPSRNLPLAILIGIPLVTVLYILVNISYFTVMSATQLLESSAVAVTWGHQVLGVMAWLVPFSVALSTLGAANGTLFSSGRLPYAAAREGHMIGLMSYVHIKNHTPTPSLVFTALISLIMIIPSNIESLITFFSFAVWLFYGGTMLALIVMRFTKKDEPRPFKVPIVIPILTLLASIFLVFTPIIAEPRLEFLYVTIFILAGLIVYFPLVYFGKHPPCMPAVTSFFQLLMDCATPANQEASSSHVTQSQA